MRRRIIAVLFAIGAPALLIAQGPPAGRGAQPARSPKDAAPVDLTGYWVSLVTEDWRWRMVTPIKGAIIQIHRWMQGEGPGGPHYDNFRDRRYKYVGIGVWRSGHDVYVAYDFWDGKTHW